MADRETVLIQHWHDGRLETSSDITELGKLIGEEGSRTWVDLTDPTAELVEARWRARIGLHPLVAEDIIESNERAKVSSSATSSTSSHVRPAARRADDVAGARGRLRARSPASCSRRTGRLGPRRRPTSSRSASGRCSRRARTTCCGRSWMRSSTATSRCSTASATRSTRSRTRGRAPRAGHPGAPLPAEARAHPHPPRARAVAGGLRAADEPRVRADRRAERLLLPRRVRPPDPAERRARLVPRADGGLARDLPVDDQQQPLDDHEAAHRRHGDPRRNRRDRRACSG